MGRKRKSGEGTIRLRKDGRWEGRVVIGYDEKGLPKTKNVLAKTKGECVEKLKALKETIAPSTPSKVRADMPFGEWLDHWYETYCKPTIRPRTQRTYEGYLRLYIKPKLGSIPLNKLTTNDIQQFCAWMKSDDHIGGSGISDGQIRNCFSLCHRALEKARAEHLISRDPTDGCKLSPVRYEEMKILSREAMQKLLVQAKEEKYYELFLLELATGLRLGEIAALQWDDLNLETGELRINKQAGTSGPDVVICEPKTKAGLRVIPMLSEVKEALLAEKAKRRNPNLEPFSIGEYTGFIFLNSHGKVFTPAYVFDAIQNITSAFNREEYFKAEQENREPCYLPKFSAHILRHTFCTRFCENEKDLKIIQDVMGHRNIRTTMDVYNEATESRKIASFQSLEVKIKVM